MVSWLLFRIGSFDRLVDYVGGLLRLDGGTVIAPTFYLILILAVVVHFTPKDFVDRRLAVITRSPRLLQAGFYAALILAFIGLSLGAPAFIYFQF